MNIAILLTLASPTPHEALAPPSDWVIHSGTEAVYDTAGGLLALSTLEIQEDAVLRVVGERPFRLVATAALILDGTLILDGDDSPGVLSLNTTNVPEVGAKGQAGGGDGGVGSRLTQQSTPVGGQGYDGRGLPRGGQGGETSYALQVKDERRGAGGGGGALGPDQPVHADPLDPSNQGLVATRGWPGGAGGLGAISQSQRASGGQPGDSVFVDNDPTNDFWGTKSVGGSTLVGELAEPLAGRGGGAGGDAVDSSTFPLTPFSPVGDEKGAGGGGGGGLGLILTRAIRVGPVGRLQANGGAGGGGENTSFFDRVGGGSGGGSGGMLVIEAQVFDFTQAADGVITAKGGRGGVGRHDHHDVVGAGGNGGPGIIQLHTQDGTETSIMLPTGKALGDLTAPDAHVLLPILGG